MNTFDEMVARVLEVEGVYDNDPTDAGGETFCGISRRNWPGWAGWRRIDRMKEDEQPIEVTDELRGMVNDFYRVHFWNPVQANSMGDQSLAYEMFEMAVNLGIRRAGAVLQEALNLLNRNGKSWPELVVDGAVGPRTLDAVRSALRETNGARNVVRVVNALQAEHYINLARRSPTQEKFLRGWLTRA